MNQPIGLRGVLRACVEYEDRTEIRCAVDLNDDSVFVLTETAPAIDTTIGLQLSFPNLLDPVSLSGRVAQVKVLNSPGAHCGFVCALDTKSPRTRNGLSAIRARLTRLPERSSRQLGVLLVEESRLIRDMFGYAADRYFAQRKGKVSIDGAQDVAAARAKLQNRAYDLVLVDYVLPNHADGASLVETIRADPRMSKTPILALSGGGSRARTAMLGAGADLFLGKPIVLKDLFSTFELIMATKEGLA